jgi:hypothetical protein
MAPHPYAPSREADRAGTGSADPGSMGWRIPPRQRTAATADRPALPAPPLRRGRAVDPGDHPPYGSRMADDPHARLGVRRPGRSGRPGRRPGRTDPGRTDRRSGPGAAGHLPRSHPAGPPGQGRGLGDPSTGGRQRTGGAHRGCRPCRPRSCPMDRDPGRTRTTRAQSPTGSALSQLSITRLLWVAISTAHPPAAILWRIFITTSELA